MPSIEWNKQHWTASLAHHSQQAGQDQAYGDQWGTIESYPPLQTVRDAWLLPFVSPDKTVLEIGTGSGYQAAILGRLCREVVSVERVVPLAKRASAQLEELGCTNVEVLAGDASFGLEERGPWDTIVVTACAPGLPEAMARQLRDGGLLLIPIVHDGEQVLYRYRRRGGELEVEQSVKRLEMVEQLLYS